MKINKSVNLTNHGINTSQTHLNPIIKFFEILLEWDREATKKNKPESSSSIKEGAK